MMERQTKNQKPKTKREDRAATSGFWYLVSGFGVAWLGQTRNQKPETRRERRGGSLFGFWFLVFGLPSGRRAFER
jgi:hypothetical protein